MSGSLGYPTTPFSDAERVDIRRFAGYPAYGPTATSYAGWRYFQQYGLLEYRMTNAAPAEIQVVRQYLAQLYVLEAAIPAAGPDLDTQSAAVWTRNPKEVQEKTQLFDSWRRRLCKFWGVPPGPELGDEGIRFVV